MQLATPCARSLARSAQPRTREHARARSRMCHVCIIGIHHPPPPPPLSLSLSLFLWYAHRPEAFIDRRCLSSGVHQSARNKENEGMRALGDVYIACVHDAEPSCCGVLYARAHSWFPISRICARDLLIYRADNRARVGMAERIWREGLSQGGVFGVGGLWTLVSMRHDCMRFAQFQILELSFIFSYKILFHWHLIRYTETKCWFSSFLKVLLSKEPRKEQV